MLWKIWNFEEGEGIIRELRLRKIEQEMSVKNIELEELFLGGYLRRSPLENNPSTAMSNLRTKSGNIVATEIFEYYESLFRRGEENKLDNYETWALPIIKIWWVRVQWKEMIVSLNGKLKMTLK